MIPLIRLHPDKDFSMKKSYLINCSECQAPIRLVEEPFMASVSSVVIPLRCQDCGSSYSFEITLNPSSGSNVRESVS